jgi:hypothetical protein
MHTACVKHPSACCSVENQQTYLVHLLRLTLQLTAGCDVELAGQWAQPTLASFTCTPASKEGVVQLNSAL